MGLFIYFLVMLVVLKFTFKKHSFEKKLENTSGGRIALLNDTSN
jgi:hypothetical protein